MDARGWKQTAWAWPVLPSTGAPADTDVVHTASTSPPSAWVHALLVPGYLSALSLVLVFAHVAFIAVRSRFRPRPLSSAAAPAQGYVAAHGGAVILAFEATKTASAAALTGVSLAAMLAMPGARRVHHLSIVLTAAYATLLMLASLLVRPSLAKRLTALATLLLLTIAGVYTYRDVWPLATFTLVPLDRAEGALLWAKYALAVLAGVVLPLTAPHAYEPVDPAHPSAEPAPEQTASWLSFMLFSFLDPLVLLANRSAQLQEAQIPPLADYDTAAVLVRDAFPVLDHFTAGTRRPHVGLGLLRVFRREFALLCALTVLKVASNFAAPVGINRLLAYLESRGAGAVVRPWVWAAWLFLGPLAGAIALQAYVYYNTRTLVRAEALITQLVFAHALRVRMKADAPPDARTAPPTRAPSPARTDATDDDTDTLAASESTAPPDLGKGNVRTATGDSTTSTAASSSSGPVNAKAAVEAAEAEAADGGASSLVGRINNLVTIDLNNITDGRDFLMLILWAPLELALSMWFLYFFLGWASFVGLAVMVALLPVPGYLAKRIQDVQTVSMKKTDARVQTITETLNVLRMVKLFGWERNMNARVGAKRADELALILQRKLLELVNSNMNYIVPLAHMIASYATFVVLMKRPLSASIVFSTMSVFTVLREQLWMVLGITPMLIRAKVSLDRVNEFLQDSELLDEFAAKKDGGAAVLAPPAPADEWFLGFQDAEFTWAASDGSATPGRRPFRLRVAGTLAFPRGAFSIIVGPTGAGKTSVLMALLGEMHFAPGALGGARAGLPRAGGVAYAAQESWVQNETIRDNILFGAPLDQARYDAVVEQCGLARDLTLFEAGDMTEVGEKGLTLSGGQKARITLARAVYSSAEIVLLDDVLAALDVHTAKWIVDRCFRGDLLRGRTVILVTHNVAMAAPVADFVVSLGADGRVRSRGSVEQALARDSALKRELAQEERALQKAEAREADGEGAPAPAAEARGDGKLIMKEEVAEGHVSWAAMQMYLSSMSGAWGVLFWLSLVGGTLVCEALNPLQTWWLGYWAQQYETHAPGDVDIVYYLTVYTALLALAVVAYCVWVAVFTFGQIRASRSLHRQLIDAVLGTTLRWLDTTPTSRILARCTRDINAVDNGIPQELGALIDLSSSMATRLAAVVIFTPVFVIPGAVLALVGGAAGQLYIKAQLAVKRHMSVAHAPVLGHFGAAIVGMVSIRAYGATEAFKRESMDRINRYTRTARSYYNLNRWICIRIDALGGLFAASLAAYLVYGQDMENAANTGFSITMAVTFSSMILWWVRVLNQLEVSGNSLERIQEYTEIEQEPRPTEGGVPPAYWPASGELRVEKLSARYSADGPRVLHEISFHIKSGERVGVVGRTGSGKSSLTLSLLRCIFTEGTVYYDGLPTSAMNLENLRENITIIPQMPELLSGSLRQNLDPFGQRDDAALNDALRAAGLFSLQSHEAADGAAPLGLDSAIASGGGNLSVGQRQILALARALVRQSKVLILDEATSAIDYETDAVIQASLRRELPPDVTVLTIAHRLQSVMDSDVIMVLDAGRIVELDSPDSLLKNPAGLLRALVDESGDKDQLYEMAAKAAGGGRA